jgi:MFS family permease
VLFARGTWRDPALSSASQAGLVNNLNDGLAWGLFPLFFAAAGLSVREIGLLAFVYPATWGVTQLATGALSDRWGRKWLIVAGMLLQAAALAAMIAWRGLAPWAAAGVALGVGTAMVYPTLLAAIGDVAHPTWRGSAVGVYRLWRDLGYAVGAILAGLLADAFGMATAIGVVAGLTAASGLLVALRMPETLGVHSRPGPTRLSSRAV